jgi:ubiquinone/menaquinone biosynthesis C-methylase UbiE
MSYFEFWKKIWDSKGESDSKDLIFLGGHTLVESEFNIKKVCDGIKESLDIKKTDSILEVGCGVGALSTEFEDFNYTGVDYSEPLVEKYKILFKKNNVFVSEATKLPFEDNTFDKVFSFGVFHYFPSSEYTELAINEMIRVAKDSVFISDLRKFSSNEKHYIHDYRMLEERGFEFSECLYMVDETRYNAYLKVNKNDME